MTNKAALFAVISKINDNLYKYMSRAQSEARHNVSML